MIFQVHRITAAKCVCVCFCHSRIRLHVLDADKLNADDFIHTRAARLPHECINIIMRMATEHRLSEWIAGAGEDICSREIQATGNAHPWSSISASEMRADSNAAKEIAFVWLYAR